MADDRTLLAHIALKLGTHPENIAVEALGHILRTSKAALRAIEDLLKAGGAEIGTISHVRTQATDKEGGIPDLACSDQHGVERVLIEAKFWAGLTEHQPVTYLKRLPTDKPSALLFVAPRARFESLWAELDTRVTDERIDWRPDRDGNDANLWTAEVGGKRRLMLTSWKAILDSMASSTSIAGDSHAQSDIRQLLGLTQRMDEDAFLPLRAEELGPEFPRRVLGLKRLVEDVAVRVSQEKWANKTSSTPSTAGTYYGWYMLLAGTGIWFGYWFDPWAKHRDTPLWVEFSEWDDENWPTVKLTEVRRKLAPLQQEDSPGIIDQRKSLLVPIDLPLGVEYDTVLDAVVKRLEEIARLIDSADTTS